jgi:hypothetical protein
VVLEPDVAKAFPNAETVNAALRALAAGSKRRRAGKKSSGGGKRPLNEMKLTRPVKR